MNEVDDNFVRKLDRHTDVVIVIKGVRKSKFPVRKRDNIPRNLPILDSFSNSIIQVLFVIRLPLSLLWRNVKSVVILLAYSNELCVYRY